MRKMILASATALSMVAFPALAQTNHVEDKRDYTEDQQAIYDAFDDDTRARFDAWPVDHQYSYFGWEPNVQTYYWTLDDDQQNAWWYLDDNQRVQLYSISDMDQRNATWMSITDQVAKMENAKAKSHATKAHKADGISFVSNEIVQDMPISKRNHDGVNYPICESDADDHCMNAWAAGQRGPNVDRPIAYWPGQSVTEMRTDS